MGSKIGRLAQSQESPKSVDKPQPGIEFVDWKIVAQELFEMLTSVVEEPHDAAEWAPQGDNDFQDACFAEAMRFLAQEAK